MLTVKKCAEKITLLLLGNNSIFTPVVTLADELAAAFQGITRTLLTVETIVIK
jgi:hypothetical protein